MGPSQLLAQRALVVDGSNMSAELLGLGHTEIGVEGQGALVVLACTGRMLESMMGVAEAGVSAGLLMAVADVGGDGESGGVVDEGVSGLARRVCGFAEAVECPGFRLDGIDDYVAPNEQVLYTDQSFTVSAWVKLTNKTVSRNIITQPGTSTSPFVLQYNAQYDRWVFKTSTTDSPAPVWTDAPRSTSVPVLNTWTHLAGVYDATRGELRQLVNGVLEGTATNVTTWSSTGRLEIGKSWQGDLDEVRVYQGAASYVTDRNSYTAASDYTSTQGANNWYYYTWDGNQYAPMTRDTTWPAWRGPDAWALIFNNSQHPGDRDSVRAWVAPKPGMITLASTDGQISVGSGPGADGVLVKITKNGTNVWPATGYQALTGTQHTFQPTNVTVNAGDTLYFHVNKNGNNAFDTTTWNQTITYM